MKISLPTVLSATALVVALFGSTPLGHATGVGLKSGLVDAKVLGASGYKVVLGTRGPRGPRGRRGPRGFRGHQGTTGTTGPTGLTGAKGDRGPTGAVGPLRVKGGDVGIGTDPIPSWGNGLTSYGPIRTGTGNQSNCDLYLADDTCFYDEQNGTLSVKNFAGNAYAGVKAASFTVSSDRAVKKDFRPIDSGAILRALVGLPITTWSYKTEAGSPRHIGPMAQDFAKAFQVGEDNKSINLVDGQGVNMAATQALYKIVTKQQREITQLQKQVRVLQRH